MSFRRGLGFRGWAENAAFSVIGTYLGRRRKLELKQGNLQAKCSGGSLPGILKYCVNLSIRVLLSEE